MNKSIPVPVDLSKNTGWTANSVDPDWKPNSVASDLCQFVCSDLSVCSLLIRRRQEAAFYSSKTAFYVLAFLDLPIATDKALFSSEKYWYLSYFFMKTYVVGTH